MRETTDVLLRITSSAICGTDLHFYEGRMRGIEGGIIASCGLCCICGVIMRPAPGALMSARLRLVSVETLATRAAIYRRDCAPTRCVVFGPSPT